MMRNFFTFVMLSISISSLSEGIEAIVRENCQTNVLYTWEGAFGVCEVASLSTNDLYVCTYTNSNYEGTLVEIYSCRRTNEVTRVFQSDRNVKGVTPVILQIGSVTNSPNQLMWGLWRHPGNGGNMHYEVYEYSNLNTRVMSTFEYAETDDGHSWFEVGTDEEMNVVTNLDFTADVPLWTNLKTRYKTDVK